MRRHGWTYRLIQSEPSQKEKNKHCILTQKKGRTDAEAETPILKPPDAKN